MTSRRLIPLLLAATALLLIAGEYQYVHHIVAELNNALNGGAK